MGQGVLGQYLSPTGPEALPLRVDANGQLYVVMTGADIEIGAVEIKDADSDLRAQVTAQGLNVVAGPVDFAAADVDEPLANVAAVVTYAAAAGLRHVITGVAWSYYGGVPYGRITVQDAGANVFVQDIADEGCGFVVFPSPKRSAVANTALVITLAAAGVAGVEGKLSILSHWTE